MAAEPTLLRAVPVALRVLLVEDDANDAELMRAYLAEAVGDGAEVLHVRSLGEGLRLLQSQQVHLTLLDLDLPDSTGFHTLERMRTAAAGPVIVVSGNGHPSLVEEVLKRRAYDVIPKHELDAAMLRRILRLARLHYETGQALRSTEGRFRALIENSNEALVLLDADGRVEYASASMRRVLGFESAEALGRHGLSFVHSEDRAAVQDVFLQLKANPGASYTQRVRFLHKDGSPRLLESSLVNRLDDAEVAAIVCNYRDLTREEEHRARFDATFEHAAIGLAHVGLEGHILLANRRLCEMFGHAPEELVGRAVRDLSHPEDIDSTSALRAQLRSGAIAQFTARKRYLRRDGTTLWVQLSVSLQRDAYGRPQYDIAAFQDVSEMVRAEEHLRTSEARLRAIIGAEPECVKLLDTEGRLLDMNPAGLAMIEADSMEVVAGHCVYNLVTPEYRDAFRALTERVCRGERGSLEFEAVGLKGARRWMEMHAVPLRDEASGKTLLLGITRDVTSRKSAEFAAQRLRRMYAALSATNEAILKTADGGALYRRVCELLVEHGGLKLAAVRLVDQATGWIEPVAHAGDPASYLAGARVSVDRSRPQAHGPSARAVLAGCTLVNNDYLAEPSLALWHAAARAAGIAAMMSVPLRRGGESIGLLSLYAGETGWFDPELVGLAERMAENVSFALDNIDREAKRRAAERALRDSEERFRSLTDLSSDWYWEQDAELRFVATGGTQDARGGITAAQHYGLPRWELPGTEALSGSWDEHKATLAARLPFRDLVLKRTGNEGTVHYVSVSGEPIFGHDGGFLGYRGIAKDVTASHEAVRALQENERRLSALFSNLPGMAYRCRNDANWTSEFVSEGARALTGYAPDEFVSGRVTFAQLMHPEDRARAWNTAQEALRNRAPFVLEYRIRAADGSEKRVWERGTGVYAPDGSVLALEGFIEDITERRLAEAALRESEERFRSLTALSSDWYWEQDAEFRFTHTSVDHGSSVYGDPARAQGKARWDLPLTPLSCTWQQHRETLAAHRSFRDFEYSYAGEDGKPRYLSASGYPVYDPGGRFTGYRGIAKDISERKHAERHVRVHAERQEAIARFGQFALDRHSAEELYTEAARVMRCEGVDAVCVLEMFTAAGEYLVRATQGEGPHASLGKRGPIAPDSVWPDIQHENAPRIAGRKFLATRPLDRPWRAWLRDMGSVVYAPVRDDEKPIAMLCLYAVAEHAFGSEDVRFAEAVAHVLSTVLQRQKAEERLAHLAQFDALTGLPNRTLVQDRLEQSILQSRRRHAHAGVLFVDLDRFKLINDSLGRHLGDALIRQVGERLLACVRPGDTVGRISGDEFAVVLADMARPDDAALVAQKVLDTLARPFDLGGNEAYVTASLGIAAFPGDGDDAEALLKNADMAMYRAKEQARNSYCFFTAQMNERSVAKVQLNTDLRHAIERSEFQLHYQPKVDLASGKLRGMEALLRWNHPLRGMVSPGEFIPALEDSGLIVAVGEWVVEEACRQVRHWQAAGCMPVPVAVNLSPKQFRRRDLDAQIGDALARAGLSAEFLELEITESCLMENPEDAVRVMRNLRAAGLRISIDDFGTGYSSLSYLTRLPLSALKIDRSFVRDADSSAESASIVRAVIDMAQNLRLTVIAEGVETEQQAGFLRRHGCDQAQGYFYGRPVAAEKIGERLVRA